MTNLMSAEAERVRGVHKDWFNSFEKEKMKKKIKQNMLVQAVQANEYST